jgi:hypothetical protein
MVKKDGFWQRLIFLILNYKLSTSYENKNMGHSNFNIDGSILSN